MISKGTFTLLKKIIIITSGLYLLAEIISICMQHFQYSAKASVLKQWSEPCDQNRSLVYLFGSDVVLDKLWPLKCPNCICALFSSSLPRQHAEIPGVSLIFVVDYMPVSVVHLDALPNRSTHRARLGSTDTLGYNKKTEQKSDWNQAHSFLLNLTQRTSCFVPLSWQLQDPCFDFDSLKMFFISYVTYYSV